MISPPLSPKMARKLPGNDIENEHQLSLPLSPKRSFAQDGHDLVGSKRRHVLLEGLDEQGLRRRVPLDPLAVLDTEHNSSYGMQWPDSDLHISLSSSPSCPELQSFSHGKSWGQPCSATGRSMASSVYTWPPAVQCDSTVQNLMPRRGVAEYDILCYPGEHLSPHRTLHKSTSTLPLSENLGTATMLDAPQAKYGSPLSTPTRTNSLPCVRCPPGDLWQATIAKDFSVGEVGSSPLSTACGPLDDGGVYSSFSPSSPPGLSPYRPKLTRRGSDSNLDLNASNSVSLFLASGSQPLHTPEQPKSSVPIGAERSRVMRIISSRSPSEKSRLSSTRDTLTDDPSFHLWYSPSQSLKLQSKLKTFLEDDKLSHPPRPVPISQEDFCRLLRQATNNRFAPKIFSPLNPLRTSVPPSNLAADPTYVSRMPSLTNMPSPRYTQSPSIRVRTTCDVYQSSRFEEVCGHCRECKRDSVGKRFLAFKYRQMSQRKRRSYDFGLPIPGRAPLDMLGGIDCDERSLWDEVATVTSTEPFPRSGSATVFSGRTGRGVDHVISPTARVPDIHAFDDFPAVSDEDMLTHVSLREVSVF
ncbi:hypothetical protein EDD17DRAFT_1530963 [Pisolithus thermaeus]|nr:hypothetical protein EV401DRAFT_1947776 [Pisolithus croceorrhizus]KAI6167961.1 hypothetical protein EDD17DRAFT_1530963 [Pisolithus thermaeus]